MKNLVVKRERRIIDFAFIGIFVLGVIFLRVFYITRTAGPFIYADEFGYWAHAAHMTGHTWAGVMDGVSWYSFGYSLWLALTFLFSSRMIVMYRIAIILNTMMGLGIYGLAYAVIRKLTKEQERITSGFIAFAATCFPTYIFYSYTTMCETAVALVVWLLFYELVSLEEKPKWWKGVLLGLTAGYAYMVHNRLLTAILAVGGCLLLLAIRRKIDWKIIISFVGSILIMLFLYIIIKDFLEGMIVENQVLADAQVSIVKGNANTFQNMWRKFVRLFSPERIKRPFLSLMGQLWQCLSSTYLLAGVGAVYVVRFLWKNLKREGDLSGYVFPLLAVVFSVGLTSITAYGPEIGTLGRVRIDPAFYGRYNECYFPLLIMMALVFLCNEELCGTFKICAGILLLYLALSVGMYFRLRGIDGYLNIVSAVSIHIFHWLGEFSVWKCVMTALLGSGIIVGLCGFKRIGDLGRYAGMAALVFLFSTTALYCMRTSIRGENDYTARYTPMFEYLTENTQKGDIVYICQDGKMSYDLQTRLPDKSVVCTLPERLEDVQAGTYVVIDADQLDSVGIPDYEVCLENEEYIVIRVV